MEAWIYYSVDDEHDVDYDIYLCQLEDDTNLNQCTCRNGCDDCLVFEDFL